MRDDAGVNSAHASKRIADAEPFQLFQRAGSSRWWVRFSVKGQGQIRLSLGTNDEAEARRKAQEQWCEANYRAKQGITAIGKTFTQVAQEFIEQIDREAERGERRREQVQAFTAIIRRYFIAYFGSRPVDSISEGRHALSGMAEELLDHGAGHRDPVHRVSPWR